MWAAVGLHVVLIPPIYLSVGAKAACFSISGEVDQTKKRVKSSSGRQGSQKRRESFSSPDFLRLFGQQDLLLAPECYPCVQGWFLIFFEVLVLDLFFGFILKVLLRSYFSVLVPPSSL